MALYLGSEKVKLIINNSLCTLEMFSTVPITNGSRLLSSEGYTLKSSDGLYMTVKEDE